MQGLEVLHSGGFSFVGDVETGEMSEGGKLGVPTLF